jgi:hypothetical protein
MGPPAAIADWRDEDVQPLRERHGLGMLRSPCTGGSPAERPEQPRPGGAGKAPGPTGGLSTYASGGPGMRP